MIVFLLFCGGFILLSAALVYWWQPERTIANYGGDAFAASVVKPRNRRLHAKAMTQEKNLYDLYAMRYKRLKVGVDLEYLMSEIQRRQWQRSLDLLELDGRYQFELRRQLQALAPPTNAQAQEHDEFDSEFASQKRKAHHQAQMEKQVRRQAFDQAAEEVSWLQDFHQSNIERFGPETAEELRKEMLKKIDQNRFDADFD